MNKRERTLRDAAAAEDMGHRAEASPSVSIYNGLRDEILLGALKPGVKLRVEAVCDRYNSGLSPVRDALARLSAEGLISQFDQRGFFVSTLCNDELRELVTTRCWLEELAFARSIANRDRAWEERLNLAFERMSRTQRSTSTTEYRINKEWEARHRAFHDALVANCDSRPLLCFCRELRDRTDRYRHIAAGGYSFPVAVVEQQHIDMMTFAIDGRTGDALRTLREHFQITWTIVEQAVFARKAEQGEEV